jgi:hypothetical protein
VGGQALGAGLVERPVTVPTVGSLDAGGTPILARASFDDLGDGCQQLADALKGSLADPDASWMAVVKEDARAA